MVTERAAGGEAFGVRLRSVSRRKFRALRGALRDRDRPPNKRSFRFRVSNFETTLELGSEE